MLLNKFVVVLAVTASLVAAEVIDRTPISQGGCKEGYVARVKCDKKGKNKVSVCCPKKCKLIKLKQNGWKGCIAPLPAGCPANSFGCPLDYALLTAAWVNLLARDYRRWPSRSLNVLEEFEDTCGRHGLDALRCQKACVVLAAAIPNHRTPTETVRARPSPASPTVAKMQTPVDLLSRSWALLQRRRSGFWLKRYRDTAMSSVTKDIKENTNRIRCLSSWRLPRQYLPFRLQNEDTHAHASLDALMSMVFPVSHRHVELHWANRASVGSRNRRGDLNKPDATILKDTFEVGFVEVKPPQEERHEKAFLEDQRALATFAKDAIDYHLRHGRPFKSIPYL
ncbi:hypothetical protein DFQ26_007165 [Actinomortierella ambigua]|nr:hypothetical protein DFQ26_007165 [Actinomortierella ambigua]